MKTLTTAGPQSLPAGDYYPLQDLLYRTTALTNSSGSIVEAYDYDAYGNTLIFSAAGTGGSWWADDAVQANYGACDVLYCGYRYDPELQTYQVRNREYNPALGRWLQRDPIGFDGGDWNLYGYIQDNPVNGIDGQGLKMRLGGTRGALVNDSNSSVPIVFDTEDDPYGKGADKRVVWTLWVPPCYMSTSRVDVDYVPGPGWPLPWKHNFNPHIGAVAVALNGPFGTTVVAALGVPWPEDSTTGLPAGIVGKPPNGPSPAYTMPFDMAIERGYLVRIRDCPCK